MLLWGLTLPLALASIRRGAFRANALNKTLQLTTQATAQLGLGVAGAGGAGLVVGYCTGYVVRLGHFFRSATGPSGTACGRCGHAACGSSPASTGPIRLSRPRPPCCRPRPRCCRPC